MLKHLNLSRENTRRGKNKKTENLTKKYHWAGKIAVAPLPKQNNLKTKKQ